MKLQTRIPSTQLVDNGSYAEYIIAVTLDGQQWTVHKRYREFDELQGKVVKSVELPPFPQKKWFGSNSPEVIEQRRVELERWLSAAVQAPECLSDPAFLGFLAVPLPSPVARASGVTPTDVALTGGPGGSTTTPGPVVVDASVEVPREMDENEFADLLLEQTQALLIDVAEIPRPLEGDEVEQRMEGYSDEIAGIALKLPPTADRLGQQQGRRKQMSQGFGLPLQASAGDAGVNALLQAPSSATADKELMDCVENAADLLTKGMEAFVAPVPGALPLLVTIPTAGEGEEVNDGPPSAGGPAGSRGSLQGY